MCLNRFKGTRILKGVLKNTGLVLFVSLKNCWFYKMVQLKVCNFIWESRIENKIENKLMFRGHIF